MPSRTERADHLDSEVDVARSVDDVDLAVLPLGVGGGGGDGDAALALPLHVVHGGRAVVDFADLVDAAGVEEDAFGRGRLARVDVRGDADVADFGQRVMTGMATGFLKGLPAVVGGASRPRPSCGRLRASSRPSLRGEDELLAKRSAMALPVFPRAVSRIQLMAMAWPRSGRTSMGTW